jgi:hypothetical protein
MRVHELVRGSKMAPSLRVPVEANPPQMMRSDPVQTAD